MFKKVFTRLQQVDYQVHNYLVTHFPRTIKIIDRSAQAILETIKNPLFALIAAFLLVVLVATNVINIIVAVSISCSWVIAMLWISKTKWISKLHLPVRLVVLILIGFSFAWSGIEFGNWAVERWQQQQKMAMVKPMGLSGVNGKTEQKTNIEQEKLPIGKSKEAHKESTKKSKSNTQENRNNKEQSQVEVKANEKKGPNLHVLFDKEFPNLMRAGRNRKLGIKTGSNESFITISEKEYLDFAGKSKFLGYYIPSSEDTYKIIEYLSDLYKTTLSDFDNKTETQFGHVAESHMTSTRDLLFSGRVYIYHESFLPLQERASLERLYESKGLSVIFRGHEYLLFIWESTH